MMRRTELWPVVVAVLAVMAVQPLLAATSWEQKSSRRRGGTSTLVTTDLAQLGARLAQHRSAAAKRVLALLPWQTHWRQDRDTPGFIRVPLSTARKSLSTGPQAAPSAMAIEILEAHKDIFRLTTPRDELRHMETIRDKNGHLRVRFSRRQSGIPVWGEDLVVHLNAHGDLLAFNGVYTATPKPGLASVGGRQISAEAALRRAQEDLQIRGEDGQPAAAWWPLLGYTGPTVTDMLQVVASGGYVRVYRVEIRSNVRDRWVYSIDARTGQVLERYNATPWDGPTTALAVDLNGANHTLNAYAVEDSFLLIDATRPMFADVQPDVVGSPRGAIVTLTAGQQDLTRTTRIEHVVSVDNSWSDPVAVSAHINMGIVFDYFLQTHGRLSIDGVGGSMRSIIHVTDEGLPMDNAFWSGTFIAYGDGDVAFDPLAEGLDVAAHEMSHGVIQNTVNLEYRNQSGALNESFADVFGVMVDREDWRLGEDVVKSRGIFPDGSLRNMEDPHNGAAEGRSGWQPAHMNEFRNLPLATDNGGVHINSGIPNRACFLIAQALGREKTESIYYHILSARLINQRGNFDDMRNAAIQAATELYGAAEVGAVEAAFTAVGIVGDAGYVPPERRAPVPGEELILVVSAQPGDRGLYLVKPNLQSPEDITLLTSTAVYDQTGNSVSVSADGSFVLFIDSANNLRLINIDGSDETVLSGTRDWSSISLSPDGQKLAATTTSEDGAIVLFDFEHPEQSRAIPLKRPTTQEGVTTSVVLFADALDWDPAGEFLIYDAFNAIPTGTGDSLSFWDVNLLEPEKEFFVPLLPPQVQGVQLGNPTIARASGRHVVFDRFDSNVDSNEVWVHDLVTGDAGSIVSTGEAIGFPTFSANDEQLLYERRDPFGRTVVARIRLDETRLRAAGAPTDFLVGAQIPNWLVVASEEPDPATSVEEEKSSAIPIPTTFALRGNHPNPFNPTTTIRFQLATAARVSLSIYDVRGARVRQLLSEQRPGGEYEVLWNGTDDSGRAVASGVYLARLQVHSSAETQTRTHRMTLLR